MIKNFSYKLTRHPKLIAIIAVLMLIPSIIGVAATKVNYDILNYLPPDLESSKGEVLLEEPFKDAATSMLIVENMPPVYTERLLRSIKDIPGVNNAVWISDIMGIQIPATLIPSDLRDMFFSENSTMMIIQYEHPGASEETMAAIDKIRSLCNENCFLAGFSVVIKDTRSLVDNEIPIFILLAVVLSFFAMSLSFESWILPFIFLADIGIAVIYNFGTNIFMGQISYITKAIAAVLQLGVTMDYSIFLYQRYQEEKLKFEDNKDAMAHAVNTALTSLSGSSLTTIAGFLALCFMQLLLGKDIGIVMAKGVVLGVLTVILVLPAFLLIFDSYIERYRHRSLIPNFDKISSSIIRHSKFYIIIFLLLFFPAIYSQNHTDVYYKLDEALPKTMPSIIANNKLKDNYNMATTHFIILDNNLKITDMNSIENQIKDLDGIDEVISYNSILGTGIPDFFVPDEIREMLKQNGLQLMVVNSSYATASDEISAQLKQMKSIVKTYDPNAYITGEAALTDDLITTAAVDFKVTNYISIAAIFLIVAILFQSLTIPIVLVSAIELAISINQGIPYFTGTVIPFISPTVIGCIQLGATVDYAILMTTRFREEIQNGYDRCEAILIASKTSAPSIITSSLVLFLATLGVSIVSKIEIISSICVMLARGALISAVVSIFILPPVLYICEPIFRKTSRRWKTGKPLFKSKDIQA